MHFDFAAFLVLATLATGLIWLWDAIFIKKSRDIYNAGRAEESEGYRREQIIVEYARSFFPVILLVLILRSFLFEPFKIPSGSMMPTLLIGDFILVNKFAYGVRIPVWEKEIIDSGKPQRGDVAVFRFPNDPSLDYIKRVIGVPGDEIRYVDRVLTINGQPVAKLPGGEYSGDGADLMVPPIRVYREKIADHEFDTLEQPEKPALEGTTIVPDGHYFMMGDNRDNSNDSRYWGFVPVENLVGRADNIWMSWDSAGTRIRWGRIGSSIE